MQDFRNLKVWEKAHQLTIAVYQATINFPKDETYGLVSQMRRASSSIPMNISEGCGRGTDAEFRRFLQIAMGSASELEYQFILIHDLGILDTLKYETLTQEVIKIKQMLAMLIKKLKAES